MSRGHRAAVVFALLGLAAAPLLTLHPITMHLLEAGTARLPHELTDGAVLVLFGLAGASLIPLATLATRLGRWWESAALVRNLQRRSEATSLAGITVRVLPLDAPAFFTAGLWRPQIYVSSGAVEQLSPKALAAGLLHEQAHLERHDVAWRAALGLLEGAFRPLPWVRRTISSLVFESEVAADRFAIGAGARRADLFDAVVAASGNLPAAARVGLASAGTMERLNLLLEPAAAPPAARALPLLLPGAGLTALAIAAHALFWVGLVCL